MFMIIQDLLIVNDGLVLINGVKSLTISYLLSTEAFSGLEMAWDMRFDQERNFTNDCYSQIEFDRSIVLHSHCFSGTRMDGILIFFTPHIETNQWLISLIWSPASRSDQ